MTDVRLRRTDDLRSCVELLERVHATDNYPTRWPEDAGRWLTPRGMLCAWVAEGRSTIVGHVVLQTVAAVDHADWEAATGRRAVELGAISRLFVDADSRGARIGRRLLSAASSEAVARSLNPVLDVVETRVNALAFYERQGWRRVLTRDWVDDAQLSHHFYVAPECVTHRR